MGLTKNSTGNKLLNEKVDYLKERADYVIYLDYSTIAQIKGVVGRYIKNHGKEKQEIPGCKEKISFKFLFWVLNWRKNKRQEIIENIKNIDSNKIHIFKTRRELNKWYKSKFKNKIKLN